MSTTIEVTGVQPSTITVGRDLGFDPIVSALDSAATKALIVHARPLAARAQALAEVGRAGDAWGLLGPLRQHKALSAPDYAQLETRLPE